MQRHDDSPLPAHRDDEAPAAARHDRRRVLRALNVSLGAVLLLAAVYSAQGSFDWTPLAVAPHAAA
ncbi:MAG TPA: rhomboid family intramembrane serine protease, partial [Xanthomonadaceae bacterium]|nr:rhomboid family intramembrane serine protease [Xanthomonadaceae bacterium]